MDWGKPYPKPSKKEVTAEVIYFQQYATPPEREHKAEGGERYKNNYVHYCDYLTYAGWRWRQNEWVYDPGSRRR